MDDWRTRIGSDSWKNLIKEECAAVSDASIVSTSDASERSVAVVNSIPPLDPDVCFCSCQIVDSVTNPNQQSYLVFQAGRLFLVGASREALQSLELARTFRPQHIVLLTWEQNHIQGLLELLAFCQRDDRGVTIWTSPWIWEETLRWFSSQGLDSARILQALDAVELEPDADYTGEVGSEHRVLVSEHLDVRLTLGVRLSLDYVPGKLPSLKASFQCNHFEITINPLDVIKSDSQLDHIRTQLTAALRSFPSVHDDFSVRYAKLGESMRLTRTQSEPRSAQWQIPEPPTPWMFKSPVDLKMVGKSTNQVTFKARQPSQKSTSSQLVLSIAPAGRTPDPSEARDILSRTAIAILCGGLRAKRQKDLLTPSRPLSVVLSGRETRVLSILEWRLHQLKELADRFGVEKLPVLLMTSPDTEEVVREQATRFEDLAQTGKQQLRISYLPQQLVPGVEKTEQGLQPVQKKDGGWTLFARGHLDFMHLVAAWSRKEHPGAHQSLCLAIPYNNLGDVLDDRTLSTLSAFAQTGRALGVEVFKLQPTSEAGLVSMNDARWDLMSYSAQPDADSEFRLYKKHYPLANKATSTAVLRYSAHTWYVNLDKLKEGNHPLFNAKAVERYLLDGEGGICHPRQDLDQTTHLKHPEVIPIRECEPRKAERGLYAHSRFLVVRTEDHLRQPDFRKAFDETLPEAHRAQSVPTGDSPFVEMVPTEMPYVWGGHLIRTLKGLPQRLVAETWEVSTHPSGPSSVYPNLREPIPLREILRNRGAADDGDLSFMAKYLDCHEPLSVQVHPSRVTAEYLSHCLPLQDNFGKEESFYVIQKAAHKKVHLFLGFDRENLAPIAQSLRPILLEYVGTTAKDKLWECYNELAKGLHESLARECLDDVFRALGIAADAAESLFLSSIREEPDDSDPRSLQRVFRYHVEEGGSNNANHEPGSLSLLGKEYLFAAIGIVRFIEEIAAHVAKDEGDEPLQKAARKFFGDWTQEEVNTDQNLPTLLKYFRAQEMRQGCWGRVPAGTTHSWQGGGNFLIELAQRSDNTFRIMDFGRELSAATRREMHYLQAMYSLSADGILDEVSSPRLIFDAQLTGTTLAATPEYHSELDCYLLPDKRVQSLEVRAWSVLMNPDNPMRLCTDTAAGGIFSELAVGRCRSVLVTSDASIRLFKTHPNDRVLLVSDRSERTDVACVSLGLTKLEVALYRSGESPSIVWCEGKRPNREKSGDNYSEKLLDVVASSLGELLTKGTVGPGQKPRKKLRVAVSWPGHIKFTKDAEELYSSGFSKADTSDFQSRLLTKIGKFAADTYELVGQSQTNPLILNDAFASALGEYRHPLGWLLADKPGMVLNVGSGICAGLYRGTTKADAETQSTIEACAAVGRWLYLEPNTGEIRLPFLPATPGTLAAQLREQVFRESVPERIEGYLRASTYLSSRGLALRFLSRLSDAEKFLDRSSAAWEYKKLEQILKRRPDNPRNPGNRNPIDRNPIDWFLKGCDVIRANPDDFPVHRMIHAINQEAANEDSENYKPARELIIEVAQDLAEVIEQLIRMLEQLAPEYAECIWRVVLTGSVGEHFGRIGAKPGLTSGERSRGDVTGEDLLLGVMQNCLASSGLRQPPDKIKRSEIAIASVRELEGFLHYLALHPDQRKEN